MLEAQSGAQQALQKVNSDLSAEQKTRQITEVQNQKLTTELDQIRLSERTTQSGADKLSADLEASKSRILELSTETGELKEEIKGLHKQVGKLEGQFISAQQKFPNKPQ